MSQVNFLPSPRRGTVGLIVFFGLLLSVLIWNYARQKEADRIHAEFMRRAQTQASMARERLRLYEEMVYGLREVFVGQDEVTRQEFSRVAGEILARHTGVQALGWIQIVPRNARAAVEQKASREIGRPFGFKQRTATSGQQPAGDADEYFIILYTEPVASNEVALGYDLASSPAAPIVTAARREKSLKISHAIRLTQSTSASDEPGLVFLLPVMTAGDDVTGFVEGVFRAQTMLSQAHQSDTSEALRCYYFDLDEGAENPTLLYANLAGEEPLRQGLAVISPDRDNAEDFHDTIRIGGQRWLLAITMDPAWARRQTTPQPALMLAAGVAITLLLALFINTLLQRTARVEREVAVRSLQLRETESQLKAVLDHSPALIFVKDLAGRYLLCNQPFEKISRRPSTEILGHTDLELFAEAEALVYREHDRQVIMANRPMEFEEVTRENGKVFVCMVQKFPLLDAEGRAYAICGIAADITDRKQAETELQENRRQLSNLISQLPGAAFRCEFDEKLTTLFASEGMLALTGYPAEDFTSGRIDLSSLTVPASKSTVRATVAAAVTERRSFETEHRILHRDGQERCLLIRGHPVFSDHGDLRFIEGLAIDVTALKQAEAEKIAFERNLLETQKLESLGVLAGGIAHDFNNLLTAVLGNASLVRHILARTDANQVYLEQIENAARRAADLCSQMLAYAGKGRVSTGPIDLTSLVRDTTSLLEISIGKNCALTLRLAEGLPAILGDATQLRQIVMNLVINGSDAIGERAEGRILVTTFAQPADATVFRTALHQPKLTAGLYVGLEVRDNGGGMPPETIARIFEPFFTTKFSGRGLGLSAVLGIVQSHNGALFVESQPGLGSTFRLLLPAARHASAPPVTVPAPAVQPRELRGTVLLVDDEESVRVLAGKVLRQHGATVLLAADGQKALDLYREQRDHIDLILLDLTMPDMSGEEVVRQLQLLHAPQKVIIMSGYGEDETMQQCAALGVVGFLSKPFEIQTLIAKLQPFLS